MVAGDVEFVFASRNEISFVQIEIKPWNNYGEQNACPGSSRGWEHYILTLSRG